ncbi:SWIM zinc finger family protein [Anaerolineales bacterium HSG25]|nr:SWIM zinc finger family protein [Anaerolineales bacterium HSG25]
MQFDYTYPSSSQVVSQANQTAMSFAPDIKREPTFFTGVLGKSLEFREAISALHDVVISDLRFKPKDDEAYKAWAAQREQIDWQEVAAKRSKLGSQIKVLQEELDGLTRQSAERMKLFYDARRTYFKYLYEKERDAWFVLDPVITVHPDEIFFECFSQDESSYGRLGASYEVFRSIGQFECGTTNIDYSDSLYNEFQKIRSYKDTHFEVDPSGFEVQTTNEATYKEVKIDLPDSWVRGFLQVSSAMSLPTTSFDLHPMDVHNLCFVLRRHKEKHGPRGMRYHLTPDEPIKVVFEPWETEVVCPRSIYQGDEPDVIRVWGRRRIHILERLIPIAQKFTVHLLGTGLPSFYIADLGHMSFTLGLSGWTANDWSQAGNFDLMAPRAEVDDYTKQVVFTALKENWVETPDALAERLNIDRSLVLGALGAYTQAGRAIYDLNKHQYRARELSREPLPLEKLRFANPREEAATRFITLQKVTIINRYDDSAERIVLQGQVKDRGKNYPSSLIIDKDQRMVEANCTCNWHQQNKLYKGPCEHILAVRMAHNRR